MHNNDESVELSKFLYYYVEKNSTSPIIAAIALSNAYMVLAYKSEISYKNFCLLMNEHCENYKQMLDDMANFEKKDE